MKTLTLNNDVEVCTVNLALRSFAQAQLTKAIAAYEGGSLKDGQSAEDNAAQASAIANRLAN